MTGHAAIEGKHSTMLKRLVISLLKLFIILFSFTTLAADTEVAVQAKRYLNSHATEKILIEETFEKIPNTKIGVISIHEGRTPVLFVHGIDKLPYYPEWVLPIGYAIEKKITTLIFTWDPAQNIHDSQKILGASIEGILKLYPNEKLTVIAHSAGGILATLAFSNLKLEDQKRVLLHTVASPLYGYKAPKISLVASPIFGKANIQVGTGFTKEMQKLSLPHCHHWVTTNCDLDKHACSKLGNFPQTGSAKKPENLPCGNENVTKIDSEDHESVLYYVVKKVLK